MKKVAYQGLAQHAPANTRTAILSSYVSGAQGCFFDVKLTKDHQIILFDKDVINGKEIAHTNYSELAKYDMSEGYKPNGQQNFRYFHDQRYYLKVELLEEFLIDAPSGWPLFLNVAPYDDHTAKLLPRLLELLDVRGLLKTCFICVQDKESIDLIQSLSKSVHIILGDREVGIEEQLAILKDYSISGMVSSYDLLLESSGELTLYGEALNRLMQENNELLGAWVRQAQEHEHRILYASLIDSIDDTKDCYNSWTHIEESFEGEKIDTANWSLGYAKANSFCHVYQDDGVHIKIKPFTKPVAEVPNDEVLKRLQELERQMQYALKTWEWYSGGGVGLNVGIGSDFTAQVDYTTRHMAQRITMEMAVVNVQPGYHQHPWNEDGSPRYPRGTRQKDIFYDPHGAPPYVGVEHDEDDGYRVNWNYGTDYDNNGYGPPVGDGVTPKAGKLMLIRRGEYFVTYYRNDVDAPIWVCCGVQKNESLNKTVFLRCVGKRWGRHKPEEQVEFVFSNLKVLGIRHREKLNIPSKVGEKCHVN